MALREGRSRTGRWHCALEHRKFGAIIPIFTLLYGGIGAGIGTGLDAMFSAERVIYTRRIVLSISLRR